MAEGKATMLVDEELVISLGVDVVCIVLPQSHTGTDSTTVLSFGKSRRTRNLYAPPMSTFKPVSSSAYGASGV